MRISSGRCAVALVALCSGLICDADSFGPSDDSTLVTGFGYDPNYPTNALGTPFSNLATSWESSGIQGFEMKMDYSSEISSSVKELYAGAQFKARTFFWSAGANFNLSSVSSQFKQAYAMNIYARTNFGTEYITNQTSQNLNVDAAGLLNNPAGWTARYGTQVVTRRTRGAIVSGRITFSTTKTSELKEWSASMQAAYNGTWSGSFSGSVKSLMNSALQNLGASITLTGYGGAGISELQLTTADGPPDQFQSYVNLINRYMSGITRENSAIIGYQTGSYRQYLNQAVDPFTPSIADVFLRYVTLKAKADALTDALAIAQYSMPWLNPDQLADVTVKRDLCKSRANAAFALGYGLVHNPKSVAGQQMPDDVNAAYPTVPAPLVRTSLNPDDPSLWVGKLIFPGAHRLKGQIGISVNRYQLYPRPEELGGCVLEIPGGVPVSGYPPETVFPYDIYDENNVKVQSGHLRMLE